MDLQWKYLTLSYENQNVAAPNFNVHSALPTEVNGSCG